jgi:hypothetical protein
MALETWQQAEQYLKDKAINLVVLDELTYMINYKYLDEQVILNTLNICLLNASINMRLFALHSVFVPISHFFEALAQD